MNQLNLIVFPGSWQIFSSVPGPISPHYYLQSLDFFHDSFVLEIFFRNHGKTQHFHLFYGKGCEKRTKGEGFASHPNLRYHPPPMAPRKNGGLSWGVLNDPVKAGYLGETRWPFGGANPEILMIRAAHFLVTSFQDSGDYDEAWGEGIVFFPEPEVSRGA